MSIEAREELQISKQEALQTRIEGALRKAVAQFSRTQSKEGSWEGNYGGPMFLLPMFVAVASYAEHELSETQRSSFETYLRYAVNSDGSVGIYEGGPGSLFTTSLTYVALRLLGAHPHDELLTSMRRWIRENGTPLHAASWGKFTLALLHLYPYEGLDPITPELWLLPYEAPIHPGRLWCHARQVYLPMAYLYGRRAQRPVDALTLALREELFGPSWESIPWHKYRGIAKGTDAYRPLTTTLRIAHKALHLWERVVPFSLRNRATEEAFHHLAYEDEVTNFLRIGPVNAVLNTACHAERKDHAAVKKSFAALEQYFWNTEHGTLMQGYNNSQLWDTAFGMQALLATPTKLQKELKNTIENAHRFVRDNQILEDVPDAEKHYRHRSRGGWPFSNRPHGWPITDCTAEGFKCAVAWEKHTLQPVPEPLLRASVDLLLSFQNDDGGWATYEQQRVGAWIEALNPSQCFGDIMADYSFTECTSAVLQALAIAKERFPYYRVEEVKEARKRGEAFLRKQQRSDGSWEGSWGVCFTYGTWFGISGLLACGASKNDPAIRNAQKFLLSQQNSDGSWGEHPASCTERRYVAHPRGQVVMTAWALSSLVRAGCEEHDALTRAASFLVAAQRHDGSWNEESFAGVFNRTCMITYDNYRRIFPIWALSEYLSFSQL